MAKYFYNHSLLDAFITGNLRIKLPFTKEIDIPVPIKDRIDFFGVNYYTRVHLRFNPFKKFDIELRHKDIDGSGIIGSVCFLDKFLKMPCVIGKSMLIGKNDLEAIGGFSAVKDVLAEDYIIGKKIHKRGKKVILSNHIIKNVNEYWDIKRFLNRHTRWGKLRWKLGGVKYFSELLVNPVFMSSLPILLWEPSRITISFAFIVTSLKILGDYYFGTLLKRNELEETEPSPSIKPVPFFYYLLSPVKDMIIGFVWFVPILSNIIVWRGNRYIIGKDTMLSACPETGLLSWRYRIFDAIKARIA